MYKLKPIPDTDKIKIKESFIKRYKFLLGDEYDEFMKYSLSFLRSSIRINTLKTTIAETKKNIESKGFTLEPVSWCKEGFFIYGDRRDFGNLLEHSLGHIYIQEAMSMVPPIVLDPKPGENVLDLCAAPGSKTTQIAQYMKNDGILVANDTIIQRARPLGINVQRLGITNAVLTLMQGHNLLYKLPNNFFDKILVDAPCSGTGTIRKSIKTLTRTSDGFIKKLSREQKRLIKGAFELLKKGGTMVYSTCTLEPWENEEVVSYLCSEFDNVKVIAIKLPGLKSADCVTEFEGVKYDSQVKNCLRVYPHLNDTEGFFVTKIKKL